MATKSQPLSTTTLVATVSTAEGVQRLAQVRKIPKNQFFELRLDLLLAANVSTEILRKITNKHAQSILLTPRHPKEGGQYSWDKNERQELLAEILATGNFIDIEAVYYPEFRSFLKNYPRCPIIMSAHYFKNTPTDSVITGVIKKMSRYKPAIFKIACHCKSTADLGRLAVLQHTYRDKSLALMGMGSLGRISRQILPKLGAQLAYGYFDKPTAPGQPTFGELKESFGRVHFEIRST